MLGFLDELAVASGEARSLYLPPKQSSTEVGELLAEVTGDEIPSDLIEPMVSSLTGAVLFWGKARKILVLPPFPLNEKYLTNGYEVEPLRRMLERELKVALVLVRLGAYAIGVARDETLISAKAGTGLVHARHKKGGSSQGRFARHREKQIEQFLSRVCGRVREQLEPDNKTVDYLVYGGARTTISLLKKQCPFLGQFEDRVLRLLLSIERPCRVALEDSVTDVWSSRVTEWRETES